MVFKSKIDWWVHLTFGILILVNIMLVGMTIASVGTDDFRAALISTIFYSVITVPMYSFWFSTKYVFKDEYLLVKVGFFTAGKIDYKLIKRIKSTRDMISSPALSMDRVEIRYRAKSGRFNRKILISPVDKEGFANELNSRCANLELDLKTPEYSKSNRMFMIFIIVFTILILIFFSMLAFMA